MPKPIIIDGEWYRNPEVYNTFSQNEDKDNICLKEVLKFLGKDFKAENPIDIGSGTGRVIEFLLGKLFYSGMFYAVEECKEMCEFLEKKYDWQAVIIHTKTKDLISHPLRNNIKSNLIISRFGFPSKIWDKKTAYQELQAINSLLTDNGYFITIGWDEEFNDELSEFFYKYIPDGIWTNSFEEWRKERSDSIISPRNSHLTIYKDKIETKLEFDNLQQSAFVMGTLFGENALKEVVNKNKIEWKIIMSITINTKKEINQILKGYERK